MFKICSDYLYTKMVKYYSHQSGHYCLIWVMKVMNVCMHSRMMTIHTKMVTIVCMWVMEVINVYMHLRTMSRPMLLLA